MKNFLIIFAAAAVVALPFLFRHTKEDGRWRKSDPVLVVVSPHIAVIRDEFAAAFSDWHYREYKTPVMIDWRAIGGTTEIMRYLQGEYAAAYRAHVRRSGGEWPAGAAEAVFGDKRPSNPDNPNTAVHAMLWDGFRAIDNPSDFTVKIDVFFGGGTIDHSDARNQGLTIALTADAELTAFANSNFPAYFGGEQWRSDHFLSAALSGFGICWNSDRLRELGITNTLGEITPPATWSDLADPRYFGQLGITDPTKSGSVAKIFEMIIHTEMMRFVTAAGWTPEQIAEFEKSPGDAPANYLHDVEQAWLDGLKLVRRIGANARYFTDGAGKVPVDVAAGDAAAGIAIDFYGRVQAEVVGKTGSSACRQAEEPVLQYITPLGGSSISGDPISILRGAPNSELAFRFVRFVISPEGQKLWNYRPGEPGGPQKSALRRMPVLREFYEGESAVAHSAHTSDNFTDPAVNAYLLAGAFEYHPRWTGSHFRFFRQYVRAACMDSGVELRAAWKAINDAGGPEANPEAVALFDRLPPLPEPVTFASAATYSKRHKTIDYMREWTKFYRASYKEAEKSVR